MGQMFKRLQREKENILTIAKRHHAENVRLFGSVARGDEHEESDVDFLVDFLPGSTLYDQIDLISELTQKLGCRVDIVSARALNKHLRQRVLDEAISL